VYPKHLCSAIARAFSFMATGTDLPIQRRIVRRIGQRMVHTLRRSGGAHQVDACPHNNSVRIGIILDTLWVEDKPYERCLEPASARWEHGVVFTEAVPASSSEEIFRILAGSAGPRTVAGPDGDSASKVDRLYEGRPLAHGRRSEADPLLLGPDDPLRICDSLTLKPGARRLNLAGLLNRLCWVGSVPL